MLKIHINPKNNGCIFCKNSHNFVRNWDNGNLPAWHPFLTYQPFSKSSWHWFNRLDDSNSIWKLQHGILALINGEKWVNKAYVYEFNIFLLIKLVRINFIEPMEDCPNVLQRLLVYWRILKSGKSFLVI